MLTKMELLEAIFRALRKDPDFPDDVGCTIDHGEKELRITIVETQQSFIIMATEDRR